jgi:hypothetical protein
MCKNCVQMSWPQICQMVYFQTKNPNLGKLWRVLKWNMSVYYVCGHSVYFMVIWCILWSFSICCGHFLHFMAIWHIFPRVSMLYQEKSGNPGLPCCGKRERVQKVDREQIKKKGIGKWVVFQI